MADKTLSDKTSKARQDPAAQPTIQAISAFSGPLPTPSDLERYGKIIPNGVERIVAMAEKEQEARLSIAKQDSLNETAAQQARATALKGAIYRNIIGTISGLIVSLADIYIAYLVTMAGHDGVGIALAALPVAANVKAFIWTGRKTDK